MVSCYVSYEIIVILYDIILYCIYFVVLSLKKFSSLLTQINTNSSEIFTYLLLNSYRFKM